jgi:hypothetical protein
LGRGEGGSGQQFDRTLIAEAGEDAALSGRVRPREQQPASRDKRPFQREVVAHSVASSAFCAAVRPVIRTPVL